MTSPPGLEALRVRTAAYSTLMVSASRIAAQGIPTSSRGVASSGHSDGAANSKLLHTPNSAGAHSAASVISPGREAAMEAASAAARRARKFSVSPPTASSIALLAAATHDDGTSTPGGGDGDGGRRFSSPMGSNGSFNMTSSKFGNGGMDAQARRSELESLEAIGDLDDDLDEEARALELVEAEVAREAEAARRTAVADALAALAAGRLDALPPSHLRLALEQLQEDIAAPSTSSPKKYDAPSFPTPLLCPPHLTALGATRQVRSPPPAPGPKCSRPPAA